VRPRLFATDFDGTLLSWRGEVVATSASRMKAARARGIAVVPVTARGPRSSLAIARDVGLGPLCICSNGVLGIDVASGEVLWRHGLEPGVVGAVVGAIAHEVPEARFAVETAEEFLVEPGFFDEGARRFVRAKLVPRRALLVRGALKVVVCAPLLRGDELRAIVAPNLGGLSLIPGSRDWLDVCAHGVSKGSGIGLGAEVLGVDLDEVGAVGDHLNDVAMFRVVGRAYAVADGHPQALDAAHEVVAACEDGGAGDALARFLVGVGQGSSQGLPSRRR
jgi:HAD superfamily hydrolase (TIGR01484 family)